jgi:hypothetical protein
MMILLVLMIVMTTTCRLHLSLRTGVNKLNGGDLIAPVLVYSVD